MMEHVNINYVRIATRIPLLLSLVAKFKDDPLAKYILTARMLSHVLLPAFTYIQIIINKSSNSMYLASYVFVFSSQLMALLRTL